MDDEEVRALVETVYRTHFNTVCVLTLNTVITNYKCHDLSANTARWRVKGYRLRCRRGGAAIDAAEFYQLFIKLSLG
jgi:hypothetical protein